MTTEQRAVIRALRAAGYAVVTFAPDELNGVSPRDVEDRLVQVGNDITDEAAQIAEGRAYIERHGLIRGTKA